MPKPDNKRPSTRTSRAAPYPVPPPSSLAMPGPTTSDAMGHRHTDSNASKRHTSAVWTNRDDEQLKRARQQGLNWTAIADTYFPNKTPNACRKRHERLIEKINANGIWNAIKFEEVAKAYLEVREDMWRMVAERVNEKWTVVESKVRSFRSLTRECGERLTFGCSAWKGASKTSPTWAEPLLAKIDHRRPAKSSTT